jgi:urea carboxylase
MWNTYHTTADFKPGTPWLLRFFDQVQFYPVTAEELLKIREDVVDGRFALDITETTFSLKDYRAFLAANADAIAAAKARQQAAFDAERQRWSATDQTPAGIDLDAGASDDADAIPEGSTAVPSPVPGNVWKIEVKQGARVAAGDTLIIVESMKMEMVVSAPFDGVVADIRCAEVRAVALGQTLLVLAEAAQ